MNNTQFQWNHRIHEEWGKEHLYFWRLGFSPTYDRDAIVEGLNRVIAAHGIKSYGYYQLTGVYDLLLRIWLPSAVTQEAFEESLVTHLDGADLRVYEVFIVSRVLLHWVWGETGQPRVPENGALANRLSDAAIEKTNQENLSESEFDDYTKQNLIARFRPVPGIKFFVVIPASDFALAKSARELLAKKLREILLAADGIRERSLYAGAGFGQFLIGGRVDHADFFKIHEQLTERINDLGIRDLFRVRTYTLVTSKEELLGFCESLPLSEQRIDKERTVESLLAEGESDTVEFKGSAFVDINRWLATSQATVSNEVTNEGVLRTIVGFLNSQGGTFIIGILEAGKFSEEMRSKLSKFPRVNEFICCGVEMDFLGKNWDAFQLRLQNVINTRILPPPTVSITIQRKDFQGQTMCVLSVRPSFRLWFYLKDDPNFYVRRGGSTVALVGPNADSYKDENPRGR